MAEVHFNLKDASSEDPTPVYLIFWYDNKRLKYSTGEKIHPDYWNKSKQRAKETAKFPEYPEFNAWLEKISSSVKIIYRKLWNDKTIPTNELIKTELEIALLKNERSAVLDFIGFIEKLIEDSAAIKAPATIKAYKVAKKHLKDYCKKYNKTLAFSDIDLEFYNSYISFLRTEEKLAENTIGAQIKNIKVFMNEATERGLNSNLDFKKRKFKKITEDNDKIYLNQSELDILYALDLTKNKKLEKVRDLFIVGCYTGLRFSDFTQLTTENFINADKIKIRTAKTDETVVIPVHRYVKEIFKKYKGELPNLISNQKMNDYLKDVAKLAELNDKVQSTITKGGKLEKSSNSKHELISSHTARRSFATNLFLADIPAITIMKITGHRTEKSFMRYIRISQEENANKLLNHPFFK
jgi:integrase